MTNQTLFGQMNTIIKKIRLITLVGAFMITLFPSSAFADQMTVPSQDLNAPIGMINQSSPAPKDAQPLPTYGFNDTAATASSPSVITISGLKITKSAARPRFNSGPVTLPTNASPLVMEGQASYYSKAGCLGCNPLFVMANGQVLDDNALTMAIGADKSYLVGHTAKVTSLATGKSVNVRITDTGGFYKDKYGNRVADLTIATKEAIGIRGGVGQVRLEIY